MSMDTLAISFLASFPWMFGEIFLCRTYILSTRTHNSYWKDLLIILYLSPCLLTSSQNGRQNGEFFRPSSLASENTELLPLEKIIYWKL
jgi:hypothetical protein